MKPKHIATAGLSLILAAACSGGQLATSAPSPTPTTLPTPTPSATPTATPTVAPSPSPTPAEPVVFVSERNAYSLQLPDESWHVTEFEGRWSIGEFFQQDSPGVDLFERRDGSGDVVPGLYLYVASQELPAQWTFDEWVEGHDRTNRAVEPCFFPGSHETVEVSGVPARVSTYSCPDWQGAGPWEIVEAMAISNGRGYAIYVFPGWVGEYDMTVPELQAAAAEWLTRFAFEPA